MQTALLTGQELGVVIARMEALERLLQGSIRQTYLENAQLQAFLGISKRASDSLRKQGNIPFSRIGNKFYYAFADIETMLLWYRKSLQSDVAPSSERDT
ncbi:helix-turn-helix domain-containing protein [Rufibacter immobilis]|uniref:helix-turn-helix domain-containing protein n=1 Tax=Rufibacter immobilis TaxID=1348778 RepID=UPI0035E5C2B7